MPTTSRRRAARKGRWAWALIAPSLSVGCAQLMGIEELPSAATPDGGAQGGAAGAAGSGTGGAAGASASGGTGGDAGASGFGGTAGAGGGGAGGGGTGGAGGGGAAGTGGGGASGGAGGSGGGGTGGTVGCAPFCGDGVCQGGEDGWCVDCRCPPTDGICDVGEESCADCLPFVSGCGDGVCDPADDVFCLLQDCPEFCDGVCQSGEDPISLDCAVCGDGMCLPPFFGPGGARMAVEDATRCPTDCACGNGQCDPGEDYGTCPQECSCGDGYCEPGPEDAYTCDLDCYCGDLQCVAGESPANCPQDCAICGDSQCSPPENASSCPQDCAVCGDGVCAQSEPSTCPQDCTVCGDGVCAQSEPSTCPQDCTVCGDGVCVQSEPSTCPQDCCGNGVCDPGETPATCPQECCAVCAGGDGCCGPGCNSRSDYDCPAVCGNGLLEQQESCDDANGNAGDGCTPACAVEPGFTCVSEPSLCQPIPCTDSCGTLSGNGYCEEPATCAPNTDCSDCRGCTGGWGGSTLTFSSTTTLPIPDADPAGVSSTLSSQGPCCIAAVWVTVSLIHTYSSDLQLTLLQNGGGAINLLLNTGGPADLTGASYVFSDTGMPFPTTLSEIPSGTYTASGGSINQAFFGSSSNANWTLFVADSSAGDVGTLGPWTLNILCQ